MSENKFLKYKDKPLIRRGNIIYYGDPKDKYMITLIVKDSKKAEELEVSGHITIQLNLIAGDKPKLIKQAEREGMYAAMDIAEYWLFDALENG